MRAAFTVALTVGAASAARLRATTEVEAKMLTGPEASFIETLGVKYDCREAGDNLEQTIHNIKTKNTEERTKLKTECITRTAGYNDPWKLAQRLFTVNTAKVDPEETATYTKKVTESNQRRYAINNEQKRLVNEREKTANAANIVDAAKRRAAALAAAELAAAKSTALALEVKYRDDTMKKGKLKAKKEFDAANTSADAEKDTSIAAARAANEKSKALCLKISRERKKHIEDDSKVIDDEVAPLLDDLTKLGCVDSFDQWKAKAQAARAGTSLIVPTKMEPMKIVSFVELSSATQAKCALVHNQATALLETSHFLKVSAKGPAKSMKALLGQFSTRVNAEKAHMEKLEAKCLADADDVMANEIKRAEDVHDAWKRRNADKLAEENQFFDNAYSTLQTNNRNSVAIVQAKSDKANEAAVVASRPKIAADAALAAAKETQKSEDQTAANTNANELKLAMETKNTNIETRKQGLTALKTIAQTTFNQDKSFVDDYCTSSKADLQSEFDIVTKIEQKLMSTQIISSDREVGQINLRHPGRAVSAEKKKYSTMDILGHHAKAFAQRFGLLELGEAPVINNDDKTKADAKAEKGDDTAEVDDTAEADYMAEAKAKKGDDTAEDDDTAEGDDKTEGDDTAEGDDTIPL